MTNQALIVPRPQATDWLLRWKDRDVIKVVTGLRRCGKSTVLKLAQQAFLESGVAEQAIISVDLERMGFAAPTSPRKLYDYVAERISAPRCYVFLDEPQRIKGFERAVDALYARDDCDVGHLVENAVYLELLRRYRSVRTGRWGEKEIDFVAERDGKPHYYQVALSVLDESTLRRELEPLEALNDMYPKTLLTLDRIGANDHNGIKQVNLIDWLLM